jgi:hypothetical protein
VNPLDTGVVGRMPWADDVEQINPMSLRHRLRTHLKIQSDTDVLAHVPTITTPIFMVL